MHNYTREDIIRIVEEEDVAFIRLQFTDIFGTLKNMAVTVGQLEKALNNKCMFDVSSLEGIEGEEDCDMYLYPDLSTVMSIVKMELRMRGIHVMFCGKQLPKRKRWDIP